MGRHGELSSRRFSDMVSRRRGIFIWRCSWYCFKERVSDSQIKGVLLTSLSSTTSLKEVTPPESGASSPRQGFFLSFRAEVLRSFLAAALLLVHGEAQIKADGGGFSLYAIDPSQVALLLLFVPRAEFVEYSLLASDAPRSFDVKLDELYAPLKRAGPDDLVSVAEVDGVFAFTLRTKGMTREERVRLYDFASREPRRPIIVTTAKVVAPIDVVEEALRADTTSVKLSLRGDELFAEALERDELKSRTLLTASSSGGVVFSGAAVGSFGTEYVEKILAAARKFGASDAVTLEWGTNVPARFSNSVEGGRSFEAILAPRVQNE